jgi:hypothetical protein
MKSHNQFDLADRLTRLSGDLAGGYPRASQGPDLGVPLDHLSLGLGVELGCLGCEIGDRNQCRMASGFDVRERLFPR